MKILKKCDQMLLGIYFKLEIYFAALFCHGFCSKTHQKQFRDPIIAADCILARDIWLFGSLHLFVE